MRSTKYWFESLQIWVETRWKTSQNHAKTETAQLFLWNWLEMSSSLLKFKWNHVQNQQKTETPPKSLTESTNWPFRFEPKAAQKWFNSPPKLEIVKNKRTAQCTFYQRYHTAMFHTIETTESRTLQPQRQRGEKPWSNKLHFLAAGWKLVR